MNDHRACRHAHRSDFTMPGADVHYPPDLELEPIHLEIEYRFDLEAQTVDGSVTHTIRACRAGPTRLTLHAVGFLDVAATDPAGRALACAYDGREITLDWADEFGESEERHAAITFRLSDPATGLFFSRPSEQFPQRAWYAATDNETERARYWLPTIDLPSVRPTLTFRITAEERFTILANGALEGETSNGDGTKTAVWKLEQPCPSYLTCIAIGDFVSFEDGEFGGRPVASFTSRKFSSEDLERSFGRTKEILAWMQAKLGYEFPYPKYFQFALPGYGGAMENISLVSWDDIFVLDETLSREWTWLVDQINVHEMAHSYFGDLLVCRDFAHAWLKESWATYMETLWLEDKRGLDELHYDVFTNVQAYCGEADNRYLRPIVTRNFNHSWQMYDRHLYPGGASRLHMLRKELGDETFFAGVREYVKRYAFKTVETANFRRTLEEVSGRSLGKWFDQWIHGKGYPKLKVGFDWNEKRKEGTFSIEQTQEDAKKGVPIFDLPLDVSWTIGDATERRTLRIEKAKHVFVIPMAADPVQVRVDPDMRTVMRLEMDPGKKRLKAQLTDAPDVVGRIRAARVLVKDGRREGVDAVLAAYGNESFWGVRLRMAEALAGSGSQAALDALAQMIASEEDGMVLESLLRNAGKHRDAGIVAAIEARLDAGIGLYRATQAAYEALGAQRDHAPLERLTAAAARSDPYGIEQSGALRALAASRQGAALDTLAEAARPGGASNRARPSAARSLGALGRSLERHRRPAVREQLEDLLRDPIDRVRAAAAGGLAALGEGAAIRALQAYGKRLSDQEQTDVRRHVETIRGAQNPAPAARTKELDELREKVRKLDDALERLTARVDAQSESGGESEAEPTGEPAKGSAE